MGSLLAMAWRNLWRHKRRSLITVSAMAVAVGAVMGLFAYMEGMMGMIRELMVDRSLGHVQIVDAEFPETQSMYESIDDATARVARIKGLEHVSGVTARVQGAGLLGTDQRSAGSLIIGIDPADEDAVTGLSERVKSGSYLSDPDQPEILLGVDLARKLEVELGEELVMVTQAADGSMGNALFTMVGTVSSGSAMIDRGGAYTWTAQVQDLLLLGDHVHTILVVGDDPDREAILTLRDTIAGEMGTDGPVVQTWWQADPGTDTMLTQSESQSGILLVIVFAVAGIGVLNTMLMSVFERTRELGVLKAIGMRPGKIVFLVVSEALFLGLVACVAGGLLGAVFDAYLIFEGFNFSTGDGDGLEMMGITLDPVIKGRFEPDGVITTMVSVVCMSVIASIWPAVRAARLRPVVAMRQD